MPKKFSEKTSADKKQLGFEYQDFVFFEYLIDMKKGERVGLEVLDDVHQIKNDGLHSLVQVKHSLSSSNGITNKDVDLWKSLSNWVNTLEELGTVDVEFILFTNKPITNRSGIVALLIQENVDVKKVKQEISKVYNEILKKEREQSAPKTPNKLKPFVEHLHNSSEDEISRVISNCRIISSDANIISRIIEKIEYFSVDPQDSEEVFTQILGVIKKRKYEIVKAGEKIEVTYEQFRNEFQFDRTIQLARSRDVQFGKYHNFRLVNDINPRDGLFAQQMRDIGLSGSDVLDKALEYSATVMFIEKLIIDGGFTEAENDRFESEVCTAWKQVYDEVYKIPNASLNEQQKALTCFYKTLSSPISMDSLAVPKLIVEGKSIETSDKPMIGWKENWKEIYGGCSD